MQQPLPHHHTPTLPSPGQRTRRWLCALGAVAAAALAGAAVHAGELPGKGTQVSPVKSPIAEETFQTLLVMKGLERLGYDVQPIQEVDYLAAHLAVANGDATFMADHWNPQQMGFYANAGGDAKLWRHGVLSGNAAQGYLIDKKTADKYRITHLDQLKDPELARLFDSDGDGRADLVGCTPGWECETNINHHLISYGLQASVTQHSGSYPALIADTITRYKAGKSVLFYAWTPHWVSNVLKPGQDTAWLQVPFTAMPPSQAGVDTQLPNGKNYGFKVNKQQIVANKAWTQQHPAAAKWFELVTVSVEDISAQNQLMNQGQNKPADIERHADAWIAAHQKTFDGWLAQARAAAAP
ncbi:glycine betaine/L-proline ABC transporter substrate-binding protein ProX [Comamonas faecalis]|uniref:Glycine betaine/L-proline ABC transporter substrate-binding protein ProX n=1 Tax=Comamonas faecalis TaxID=1387849 RepID=A0ABP7QWZ6_9BURK